MPSQRLVESLIHIQQITDKLAKSSKIKLTKEEFLNLANSAYDKMTSGLLVEKDVILRKLCLNLYINNKRAPFLYLERALFYTYLKSRKINYGADERT